MKHILLTTDLSQEAATAFPVAKEYASALGADVEILTIIEDLTQSAVMYALDFPVLPSQEIREQFMEKVQSDLNQIAAEYFPDITTRTTLKEADGSVPATIRSYAQESEADLIIMSTHGQAGLSRLLIGSVAERVVREAPCPVLTVPVSLPNESA